MKAVKFLSIAALGAAVLTSCSNGNDDVIDSNERVAVKFASTEASIETRVDGASWAANDLIGVYMIKETPGTLASGNILESADNICYKSAGGSGAVSFSPNPTTIYYPVSGSVKFIAYHPYTASVTGFKVPIDLSDQNPQSKGQTAIDVLYSASAATYSKTSGTVGLPFTHKLVKVVFNISNGDGVTEPLANRLDIKITGQNTEGTLDLTDGTVTSTTASADILALNGAGNTTSEAIVFAQTKAGKKFTFTNNIGETFEAAIPDDFEAGKKYTYTVTLKKTAVEITGEIKNWETGVNGSVDAK